MSRRDIIIISVLINSGLLAVLFVTAMKADIEIPIGPIKTPSEVVQEIAEAEDLGSIDEVDMVLKEYLPEMIPEIEVSPPIVVEEPQPVDENFVEVLVKSGDALEKIARANRTTVDAIRKASGLKSDKLKIGQVLKVPVGTVKKEEFKKEAPLAAAEAEYYIVKPGDNPWKIAKNHQVKFEDLLQLNNLSEERAKNLKVGEKIRVR